jgi:hypothetical protein
MMDRIVPGGVTDDLSEAGVESLLALLETVRTLFPEVVEIYDNTASLQDRTVTTGYLAPTLARAFGAGGYVGRASGRAFDTRKAIAYAPYGDLEFEAPVRDDGDVNARVWIRIREVEQSLRLIDQILERLPKGRLHTGRAKSGGIREGLALVEAFRGDVLIVVRIGEDGLIERSCVMHPGSTGRFSKSPSRATSSPTSRCATNPSIVPIRATTSRCKHAPTSLQECCAGTRDGGPCQTMRPLPSLRQISIARHDGGLAAASPSARSTPDPATPASSRSMRSTTLSTTLSVSACALSPPLAMPTYFW